MKRRSKFISDSGQDAMTPYKIRKDDDDLCNNR